MNNMIIYDLINLKKIRKALLYALCAAVTLLLQQTVFCRIVVLGVKPMFVPVIVVAIGLFENGMWGGIFGLAAGLLCDAASSDTTVLYTVIMAAIGFFSGVMTAAYINKRFYSYMIVAALALALTALCRIVPLWVYYSAPLGPLLRTGGLQVLWSLPFAVPAYFVCRAVSRREDRAD